MDETIFTDFGCEEELRYQIRTEIDLRTNEDPWQGVENGRKSGTRREGEDPARDGKAIETFVEDMLHHLSLDRVQAGEGGVVPLEALGKGNPSLMDGIVRTLHSTWSVSAEDRLREADAALGSRVPTGSESYPNLKAWVESELFPHHTSTFENTPILWRLTTERLVPDPKGEGFGCFLDYHQLSASTFDTLQHQHLEPRRAALRERRQAADERRRDLSLPASEQSEAQEEFERCRSGIEQIEAFEEVLRDLARPRSRDWSEDDRKVAHGLQPKVARFRKRLEERLETLDALFEEAPETLLEDVFTPTFRERVQENRAEWIDALEDLETACEAYAKPADEPVEAHLYDLFVYFDKLAGSTHYSSSGIFFMNYYFSKGKKYLTNRGKPRPGLSEPEHLLAELARETDADIELGEEIGAACEELADRIPSDWEERALAEVMNAGYRPVHKHGVRINITPLADVGIVPEIVEKKVL